MKSKILISLIFFLVIAGLNGQTCKLTQLTALFKNTTYGATIRNAFIDGNPEATRLWYKGLTLHHPVLANDATKLADYITSAVALRKNPKLTQYVAGTSDDLDQMVTKIDGFSSPNKTYKDVVDEINLFLNGNHIPSPANCTNFNHFMTGFGTNQYYSRHNFLILQDIKAINQNSNNLIKNAAKVDFNTTLPNAVGGGSSRPDMYIKVGEDFYIYEKKAGEYFTVESGNFVTQAGAYLRRLPINRIRWSIDNNAVDQAGVAARFYDNGGPNSILQSTEVRQKFAQFYPNAALQGAFDTPQSTYNFISQAANNQWFNTMFNNLAY